MRSPGFMIFIVGLILLIDFYVFQAVKAVSQNAATRTRTIIFITYWVLSILALLTLVLLPLLNLENHSKGLRTIVFAILVSLFFAKFTVSVFLFIDDIRRVFQWVAGKLFFSNTEGESIS